jgi:hypothetical protein
MDKALYQLKEFEENKIYDFNKRSKVKWLEKSYEAIKELFVAFKECGPCSLITELEYDQDQNIFSTTKISEKCREFYVRLYVRQTIGDKNKETKEVFLSYMKDQILMLMKRKLTRAHNRKGVMVHYRGYG